MRRSSPSRARAETARAWEPGRFDKVLALGLLVLLAIVISCSGVAPQPPTAADESGSPPFSKNEAEIPKGAPIYVRLQNSISSMTAETGDAFSAVLDEPLTVNEKTVVPEGTEVSGRVVAARKSGQLHHAGYLRLTLASINMNGKELPIQTTSIFVEGGSFGNRNLAYMGGGMGGNALIGAVGGGSRVIRSSSGASEGQAPAFAVGKNEVGFAADRKIGFRLMQPLKVPTAEAH